MTSVLKRKLKGIGLILLSVIFVFATVMRPYRRQMTKDDWIGFLVAIVLAAAGILFLLIKDEMKESGVKADEETDHAVKQFRKNLADFYEQPGNPGNTLLQQSTTQFLWHRLMLHKRRLNEKDLSVQIQAERRSFKRILPLKQVSYFDGKYRITEAKETIQGMQRVLKKGSPGEIYRYRLPNTATYQFLYAERTEEGRMICPNCGSASTRENLIDRCDYCETKFTVEDLGTRVSDYACLPDYAVEKENFDSILRRYQRIIFFGVGIPAFLFWISAVYRGYLGGRLNSLDYGAGWENLVSAAGWMISAILFCLFLSAIFIAAALFVFYFLVAPLLLGKTLSEQTGYATKKELEELKKNTLENRNIAERIRETDPLFSLEGFLANVANQLAVIHFSDHLQDAAAFTESERTEKQIALKLPEYADIIDMTIHDITLSKYETDELFQKIFLNVKCRLLMYRDDTYHERTERISLRMIKRVSCKTQSICAPKFMSCEGCGASISLLAGRRCKFCGREYQLSDVDWVIGHYSS